jgi:hypothetical protein
MKKHIADFEHSIIADAAVRRFQCQRAYLRAHAGLRWMNSRNTILRGQKPNASHLGALQQVDATLRNVCHILAFKTNMALAMTPQEQALTILATGTPRPYRCLCREHPPWTRRSSREVA